MSAPFSSSSDLSPCHRFEWFGTGRQFLRSQLEAIGSAKREIQLEMYLFTDTAVGRAFRDALAAAVERGVTVALLVDGVGSARLPDDFFGPLIAFGGEQKWFNRPRPGRWALRNHRKVLLVDQARAFVGGCNISDEYDGDGVEQGWRDGGVAVEGPLVAALTREFTAQWQRAGLPRWRLMRSGYAEAVGSRLDLQALFIRPGFGASPLRTSLREDLEQAQNVAITSAYFLPTHRLREQIVQADQRGARVRLLLAGKSDVRLMSLATQSLYRGLVQSGVEVFEYQPQILHAKTMVLDDIVYIGSSNLDPRSLRINFEIMLRIKDPTLAAVARAQFEADLLHSRAVRLADTTRFSWWSRVQQRAAYFFLAKFDPWIAREQLRRME